MLFSDNIVCKDTKTVFLPPQFPWANFFIGRWAKDPIFTPQKYRKIMIFSKYGHIIYR